MYVSREFGRPVRRHPRGRNAMIRLENIPFLSKLLQEASSTPFGLKKQLFRKILKRYGNHPDTELWSRDLVGFGDVLHSELVTVDLARSKSLLKCLVSSLSSELDVREKMLLELMSQREDMVAAVPTAFVSAFSQCLSESACNTAIYLYRKYNCSDAADELLSAVWMRGYAAFRKMEHNLKRDRERHRLVTFTVSEIESHGAKETARNAAKPAGTMARQDIDNLVESSLYKLKDHPQAVSEILDELLSLKEPFCYPKSLRYFVTTFEKATKHYRSQMRLRRKQIGELDEKLKDLKTVQRKSTRLEFKRLSKVVANGRSLCDADKSRLSGYTAIFDMVERESAVIRANRKCKANPSKNIDTLRSHIESRLAAIQDDPIATPEVVTILEGTYIRAKDLLRPRPF